MAGVKISALIAGNPLAAADLIAAAQGGVTVKVTGAQLTRQVAAALAYSASITPDSLAAVWQTITVTSAAAFTINAPINPPGASATQDLYIEVLNSSGGVMGAITWNAIFVFAGLAWVNPASTKKRSIHFRWNGLAWIGRDFTSADY